MDTATATWRADRLSLLPPYLFVEIDRRKRAAREAGRDIIDFGVGDPDQPTPRFIIDRMSEAIHETPHHRYSPSTGLSGFRRTAADYMRHRFSVDLDPNREVLALVGSKEGLGHLPTAVVNPGECVLVPEPGYPVYAGGTALAGGVRHPLPLTHRNGWLPALGDVPPAIRRSAKLLFLNYPNNPTGACAPLSFFEDAVAFGREHDILIAHDAAYADLYFNDPPPSILQVRGAADVCIEFHSLSKTFNMTGWRIAFAVGNADALAALASVKDNVDSGPFGATQLAAIAALEGIDRPEVKQQVEVYRQRRDTLVRGLLTAGWAVAVPQAGFYVWAECPGGLMSMDVASRALDEAGVVLVPGAGFGLHGEGYVRFALTVSDDRTLEAVERLARVTWQ